MSDTTRKRLATAVLALSLLGGAGMAATTTAFQSAWTAGNSQPPSGMFVADKAQFVAGSNETRTGSLTALP